MVSYEATVLKGKKKPEVAVSADGAVKKQLPVPLVLGLFSIVPRPAFALKL